MTEPQFGLLVGVLAIIWVGILVAVLVRGSLWQRNRAKSTDSVWPKSASKVASIWMLAAVLGLCGMLGLTLLTLVRVFAE